MLLGFLQGRYFPPMPYLKADSGADAAGNDSSDDDEIDGDEIESDGDEDDETEDDEETDTEKKLPKSAADSFKRLLDRYGGNTRRLAAKLFDDNWAVRQRAQLLETELGTYRKQNPKNSRVITLAQYEEFKQYRAFGKPADVKTRLDTAKTVETELATRRKDDTYSKVAELTGWSLPVLKDIGKDLEFDFDEVDDEGEKIERALVVIKDGTNVTKKPVTDYADEKWAHFMPALEDDNAETTTRRKSSNGNGTGEGRRIVRQPAASGGASRSKGKITAVAGGYMSTRYGPAKTES